MNTDILSTDAIVMEEILEEPTITLISEKETDLPETTSQTHLRFGIVDLWKIRRTKRHFRFYR